MIEEIVSLLPQIMKIIGINILLSGDNAVVIALACRGLPPAQRNIGIALGAGVAVLLRIIFTFMTTKLMGLAWLTAIGSILLIWIAVKLVVPEDTDEDSIAGHSSLWKAVQTVAIADIVMSLDNVVAIAAAANGDIRLIIFGLVLSVPLVIAGSALLTQIIDRFPVLVWAGAALLGWIAGELFVKDPGVITALGYDIKAVAGERANAMFSGSSYYVQKLGSLMITHWPEMICAAFVLVAGYFLKKRHDAAHA